MPLFQKQKNKFLKQHYAKDEIHPEQFEPVIDPNLVQLIEWAIYVGSWMPGAIGSYSRLAQVVWEVYKGYYEGKSTNELFEIAVAGLSKSRTKRFILRKFFSSFNHVFTSPAELGKKPEFKYMNKPKEEQLVEIQAHQTQIKNYILSQITQKYGKKTAEKVESKYGDNFSQIMLSAVLSMTAQVQQGQQQQGQLQGQSQQPQQFQGQGYHPQHHKHKHSHKHEHTHGQQYSQNPYQGKYEYQESPMQGKIEPGKKEKKYCFF